MGKDFRLALDCSTSRGSVALAEADGLVWEKEIPAGRGHGGQLFEALDCAMRAVRAADGQLTRIVVGLGPGSYSGVRQTVAAAIGLAAATRAELVGVPSPLALPTPGSPEICRAVGDARRGTFYHTAIRAGVCLQGPELLPDANALTIRLAENVSWPVFVVESPLPDSLCPDAAVLFPAARRLLDAPGESWRRPPLEPIYLRPVSVTLPRATQSAVP